MKGSGLFVKKSFSKTEHIHMKRHISLNSPKKYSSENFILYVCKLTLIKLGEGGGQNSRLEYFAL